MVGAHKKIIYLIFNFFIFFQSAKKIINVIMILKKISVTLFRTCVLLVSYKHNRINKIRHIQIKVYSSLNTDGLERFEPGYWMQTYYIGFNISIFFLGCTEAAHCANEADKGVCNTNFSVCSSKLINIYKKASIIEFK